MSDLTRDTLPPPETRRPLVPVELPAWGGTLYVRILPAGEVFDLPDDSREFGIQLSMKSIVYADGERVWPDDQREAFLGYPAHELEPVILAAMKVNRQTKESIEDAKGN